MTFKCPSPTGLHRDSPFIRDSSCTNEPFSSMSGDLYQSSICGAPLKVFLHWSVDASNWRYAVLFVRAGQRVHRACVLRRPSCILVRFRAEATRTVCCPWSHHALRNTCAVTTTWLPSIVPDKTAPEPGRGYIALAFLDVQAVSSFVSVPRQLELCAAPGLTTLCEIHVP